MARPDQLPLPLPLPAATHLLSPLTFRAVDPSNSTSAVYYEATPFPPQSHLHRCVEAALPEQVSGEQLEPLPRARQRTQVLQGGAGGGVAARAVHRVAGREQPRDDGAGLRVWGMKEGGARGLRVGAGCAKV